MEIEFNKEKFHELILYIAQQSEDDPRFGATKLNKLLFYADFAGYRMLGQPITGATYQHLPAGPAPRELPEARRYLVDSGAAKPETRDYFSGIQERLVPQRKVTESLFSPEELEIVNSVIAEFWNFNARRISDYSHGEWGWRATEDYEDIPYHLAWVSSDPLTPDQIEVGRRVAAAHDLMV